MNDVVVRGGRSGLFCAGISAAQRANKREEGNSRSFSLIMFRLIGR